MLSVSNDTTRQFEIVTTYSTSSVNTVNSENLIVYYSFVVNNVTLPLMSPITTVESVAVLLVTMEMGHESILTGVVM